MKNDKLKKIGAIGFIINAIIYLSTEFIAALGTRYPLNYVYSKQFISALGVYNWQYVDGVPKNFSNLAIVMNIGFILTAFGFVISYYLLFFPKLKKRSKILAYILLSISIAFGIGSLLVGLFQGGVPGQEGFHGTGARISFVMGNITLILIGIFLPEGKIGYRILSVSLGVLGFVAAWFLQMSIIKNQIEVMAIYERLTVYPITLWQIVSGILFFKNQ